MRNNDASPILQALSQRIIVFQNLLVISEQGGKAGSIVAPYNLIVSYGQTTYFVQGVSNHI